MNGLPHWCLIWKKYCYSYLNRLADPWCLRGETRRREFPSIYKPGNPSRTRGRAYSLFLFHVFNDNEEFQLNAKKYSIDNDNL